MTGSATGARRACRRWRGPRRWPTSGNYAKAHRRYACVKPFRNVLYQFAWQSTFQESWTAAYYQRKPSEGKSHSTAVRTLANVWVRIIQAMWLNHRPYVRETFLAAQHAHVGQVA
jgi:hypothetical protein